MIRIWAKTLKKQKIVKDMEYDINADKMVWSLFFDVLSEICNTLDIPTPVLLKTHILNFAKYNFVSLDKSVFVEAVDFYKLWLEFIKNK